MFKKIFKARHVNIIKDVPPTTGLLGPEVAYSISNSVLPVDYNPSPPVVGGYTTSSIMTPCPVDYRTSPPSSGPSVPRVLVAYEMNASPEPAELYGSTVPPLYELPAANTPGQHLTATPTSPPASATSQSFGSTTPLPSLQSPPTEHSANPALPRAQDLPIKRYTVDIFCPLKRDAQGIRRQQIPRDVREFRLAKVALIPIIAGSRRFVSFDVVFGETDKAYARLVEKHFSFFSETQFLKLSQDAVNGGEVYTVGPMNIAYQEGERETVYLMFTGDGKQENFKADFFDLRRYVE
ncbi:hypothetical protein DM02DRAFT_694377 [Periconia macrospinosa]|uniref:Uncharacterized protein n=1 Tax=Periconia macrospinosa TaxID=97972 RepID=A0A2V1D8X1_9PLEO|nr:hypothetical protein DM02DRAFT_694377 [Periconia macrospinosa]